MAPWWFILLLEFCAPRARDGLLALCRTQDGRASPDGGFLPGDMVWDVINSSCNACHVGQKNTFAQVTKSFLEAGLDELTGPVVKGGTAENWVSGTG